MAAERSPDKVKARIDQAMWELLLNLYRAAELAPEEHDSELEELIAKAQELRASLDRAFGQPHTDPSEKLA